MKSICICLLQLEIVSIDRIMETQQAIIPIWLIAVAIGAIVVGACLLFSGKKPKDEYGSKEEVKLAILGPNEAGKTTLWNYFAGKPSSNIYKQTEGVQAVSFIASGIVWSTIKVQGYDINGNGDYIRNNWKKIIKDSDMIIFVFNAKKYLDDELDYQRDVNQRLHFIKSVIDELCDERKRNVWLLGSYADKLKNQKEDWKEINNIIKTKPYCDFYENKACLNLTDEKILEEYYQKMFGK
jgi:GTPase SAR1 family protein